MTYGHGVFQNDFLAPFACLGAGVRVADADALTDANVMPAAFGDKSYRRGPALCASPVETHTKHKTIVVAIACFKVDLRAKVGGRSGVQVKWEVRPLAALSVAVVALPGANGGVHNLRCRH